MPFHSVHIHMASRRYVSGGDLAATKGVRTTYRKRRIRARAGALARAWRVLASTRKLCRILRNALQLPSRDCGVFVCVEKDLKRLHNVFRTRYRCTSTFVPAAGRFRLVRLRNFCVSNVHR